MVKEEVGPDDVADVVASWTGIPAGRLLEGETGKLLRMEAELGKRLGGQARAVQTVADAVRRARAGVADPALDEKAKRDAVMNVVRATFKPEFLNRLDDVIVFDALSTEELTEIVDLQIARLGRRLADRRLELTVTAAAWEWLALTGFDPVYGARPLRRLVQSAIGDQLARALLAGDISDGDRVVVDVDSDRDALTVRRDQPSATPPVSESSSSSSSS